MIVGIYIRVSTQEQATEGYSLVEQERRLRAYASAKGWTVYQCYTDAGFSGADTNRPALQQLITDVTRNNLEAVLVYKLDRLSRSQKDTLYLIEDIFNKYNVSFISMSETIDTSTPLGKAMVGVLSVFAQLERETIKERMTLGAVARAKEGKYHGGHVPIGYDYINGELVINEYEALQVRTIFELFLKGYPIKRIQRIMSSTYTNKYGSWANDTSISTILSSTMVNGKIKYKGEVYEGNHTAIIDDVTFAKAQDRLAELSKDNRYSKTPFVAKHLLTGLIWCNNCGARYCVDYDIKVKPNGKRYSYKYYTCYSRDKSSPKMIKDPNCKSKRWRVETLDQLVIEEILKLQFDEEYLADQLRPVATTSTKREVLTKRIEDIDTQLDKVMDMYQLGSIPLDKITTRTAQLSKERKELVSELDNLVEDNKMSLNELKNTLKNASDILASNDMTAKRLLVQSLIDRIEVGEDIKIYWAF